MSVPLWRYATTCWIWYNTILHACIPFLYRLTMHSINASNQWTSWDLRYVTKLNVEVAVRCLAYASVPCFRAEFRSVPFQEIGTAILHSGNSFTYADLAVKSENFFLTWYPRAHAHRGLIIVSDTAYWWVVYLRLGSRSQDATAVGNQSATDFAVVRLQCACRHTVT